MRADILDRLLKGSSKDNIKKINYVVIMIFIFSIIYTFFDNDQFAGWINISTKTFPGYDRVKMEVYYKHAKRYKNFMTKEEFLEIPMLKINEELHIIKDPTPETRNFIPLQEAIFKAYSHYNKLRVEDFVTIPFRVHLYKYDIEHAAYIPNEIILTNKYAVTDYFDRLYYSVIIQTALGFGDIFPNNKLLRLFTMLQAFSTIFIIIL